MPIKRTSIVLGSALLVIGCASSTGSHRPSTTSTTGSSGTPVLSAEAQSKATGDIPDTQAFLTYKDASAGYTISYPEGWTQSGGANDVTFHDKNNVIHVGITPGAAPTSAAVSGELAKQRASIPTLKAGTPAAVTLKSGPAIKVSYMTESPPNAVTGKRVTLTVDRYVVARAGKRATLDLGTAVGVDNRDAYRMISQSFAWR